MKFLITVATSLILASSLHAQTVKELQAEIVALQTQVTSFSALQKEVAALQNTVAIQASEISTNQKTATTNQAADTSSVAALQRQVTLVAANPVLQVGPFIVVDPNPENGVPGPNIVITGANLHIVNGSGQTPWPNGVVPASNGLGNLIVGYDELPYQTNTVPAQGRSGSHNIVVGRYHLFPISGFGNLIAGNANTATGSESFVAGLLNTATGTYNSILGGCRNQANASFSSVEGGSYNQSNANGASVLGGYYMQENCGYSTTLGGYEISDTPSNGEFLINLY